MSAEAVAQMPSTARADLADRLRKKDGVTFDPRAKAGDVWERGPGGPLRGGTARHEGHLRREQELVFEAGRRAL